MIDGKELASSGVTFGEIKSEIKNFVEFDEFRSQKVVGIDLQCAR